MQHKVVTEFGRIQARSQSGALPAHKPKCREGAADCLPSISSPSHPSFTTQLQSTSLTLLSHSRYCGANRAYCRKRVMNR